MRVATWTPRVIPGALLIDVQILGSFASGVQLNDKLVPTVRFGDMRRKKGAALALTAQHAPPIVPKHLVPSQLIVIPRWVCTEGTGGPRFHHFLCTLVTGLDLWTHTLNYWARNRIVITVARQPFPQLDHLRQRTAPDIIYSDRRNRKTVAAQRTVTEVSPYLEDFVGFSAPRGRCHRRYARSFY
jgi:hypothetical protein